MISNVKTYLEDQKNGN